MQGCTSFQELIDVAEAIGFSLGLQTVLEKHSSVSAGNGHLMLSKPYASLADSKINQDSSAVDPGREITAEGSDAND